MVRIKHSVSTRRSKKRVIKSAKGNFGFRGSRFREVMRTVNRALVYAYRDRKVKKREFRQLWIARINAGCRELGISYSRLIWGLNAANVSLDRKMLSELAIHEPETFAEIVNIAKGAIEAKSA